MNSSASYNWRKRILSRLARFCFQHYRGVLWACLLSVLLSIAFTLRLNFKTDVFQLLPQKNPAIGNFIGTLKDFGTLDMALIVLEAPEGQSAREYTPFADALARELRRSPLIDYLEYKVSENVEFTQLFLRHAFLYLPPEELQQVKAKLTDQAITTQIKKNKALLLSPAPSVIKELIQVDPFNLLPHFKEQLKARRGSFKINLASGYYLSEDESMLILMIKPTGSAEDIGFNRQLQVEIDKAKEKAKTAALEKGWPEDTYKNMKFGLTGGHFIALNDANAMQKDMGLNFISSFIGVLLLFYLSFRALGALHYAGMPLGLGIIWTLGFCYLALGEINFATSGFSALLVGLGIDFTIVLYNRYLEERRLGRGAQEAVETAISETGQGVITGAVTTTATFYVMMLTSFPGLQEMGFLTGTGILLVLLASFLVLPTLVAWQEARHQKRGITTPPLTMRSLGIDKFWFFLLKHPRKVILVSLGLTVIFSFLALKIGFEEDLRTFRPKGNPALDLQQRVGEKFGASFENVMAVAQGATPQEALDIIRRLSRELDSSLTKGEIANYDSLASYIPPREQQLKNIAFISRGGFEFERIERAAKKALRESGFRTKYFEDYLRGFGAALATKDVVSYDSLNEKALKAFKERYIKEVPGRIKIVTYIHPPGEGAWKEGPPTALLERMKAVDPKVMVVSAGATAKALKDLIYKEALAATALGLVIVTFLVYIDFRKIKATLYCIIPLLVGVVWMLGLLHLLGHKLNFMNALVVTMILGIGVDYSIHLTHRYYEGGQRDVSLTVAQIGKAIVMAALTTMVGFGSIYTSRSPGLSSMGVACILGVLCCMITTLGLLPSWLIYDRVKEEKKNAPET